MSVLSVPRVTGPGRWVWVVSGADAGSAAAWKGRREPCGARGNCEPSTGSAKPSDVDSKAVQWAEPGEGALVRSWSMKTEAIPRAFRATARLRGVAALLLAASAASAATAAEPSPQALADLSLEELGDIQVTSVSRRAESLSGAAASVFVITGEDIRRSGVTSVPEALRLAPNLQVARRTGGSYAISARGLNNAAGNKVLVLVDGRTVYSPLFSGVFWDAQDMVLEDVERIEVISGPGGTLWGTNAVNSVINVISRASALTQGSLLTAGGGNHEYGTAVRYGGTIGADGHYRVYGKYVDRDPTSLASGAAIGDSGSKAQVGFRADWEGSGTRLTLQGDAYDGDEDQPAPGMFSVNGISRLNPISISGMNVLSRWARRLDGGSDITLQAYYDRTEREVPGTFDETLEIVEVQLLHTLPPTAVHAATWGTDYRFGKDRVVNDDFIAFLPADVDQTWASLFAQDEITLHDAVRLTLGARLERNDYTGNEFLPSARVAWKVATDHLLWTAASRTVRAPSRIDRDFFYPAIGPPFLIRGGSSFRSESAQVYEIGYRGERRTRLTWSATVYRTVYDHLRTLEIAPSGTFLEFGNEMDGATRGLEAWAVYQITPNWRIGGGLTTLSKDLRLKPGSDGLNGGVAAEGNDPDRSWHLRSTHNLAERWELDAMVRGVASLPLPAVPSYVAVDLRVAWKARRDLELSLTLQNLFDDGHAEFGSPLTRSELQRTAFFKVSTRL
jgi:iron complex outermembrane recepter protein